MKVLFLNGPPGCGKDSVVRILQEEGYEFMPEKFAMPIREVAKAFFEFGSDEELEEAKRSSHVIRKFMIDFSQEVVKPLLGEDYFGKACAERMLGSGAENFVVSDTGFEKEMIGCCKALLKGCSNGPLPRFLVWNIFRPGHNFRGDSRDWIRGSFGFSPKMIGNYGTLEEYRLLVLEEISSFF